MIRLFKKQDNVIAMKKVFWLLGLFIIFFVFNSQYIQAAPVYYHAGSADMISPSTDLSIEESDDFNMQCSGEDDGTAGGNNEQFNWEGHLEYNSSTSPTMSSIPISGGIYLEANGSNPDIEPAQPAPGIIIFPQHLITAYDANTYWVRCRVYDDLDQLSYYSTTKKVIVSATPTDFSPIVTLNSPDDYANFSSTIDFNCTASDDINLVNVSLYGNWTVSGWHLNDTNDTGINDTDYIFSKTISDGKYVWNCKACDNNSQSQCNFSTSNRTFTVDATAPTITLPVYTNATPKKSLDSLIINISVDDGSGVGVDSCVVNVATATASNQTIPYSNGWCNGTYNLAGTSEGNQTINAYANDTLNNWGLNDSYVVWIDNTGPIINTEGANETEISQSEWFCLNITATDTPSGVDTVYAEVWNTTHWLNYTMTDTGTSCGGGEDNVYGVEIQGTAQGIWNYSKAHANDTLNNWGSHDFTDLTINVTAPSDTAYPQFSNFQENPINDSDYLFGQTYQFNSTVIYTNGTVSLNFDGTNYSASNISDEFYASITSLSAGTYNYYWWGYGNGTLNNYNSSDTRVYVVQQETSSCGVLFNESSGITYGTIFKVWTNCTTGFVLYRNSSVIANNSPQNLAASAYNFTVIRNDTANYSNYYDEQTFVVDKFTTSLSLNAIPSWSETYPIQTNITGSGCPSQITCTLYRDEVNVTSENSQNVTLGAGTYNYTYNTTGNENYTSDSISNNLTISQATPVLTKYLNSVDDNLSIIYPTQVNASASTTAGTVNIYRNSTQVTGENNQDVSLAVSYYEYEFNITGNQNYTDLSSVYLYAQINKSADSCHVNFNETSPITYPGTFKVWGNCTTSATLYRNSSAIENNSEQNLAASAYNFTVIRNDTVNYSNYYDEETFVVNQGIGEIATHIDETRGDKSVLFNTERFLNATLINGQAGENITLYYNGTLIEQGPSPLSNLTNFSVEGVWNVTGIYAGNENYTSNIETWWVTVSTDSAPTVTIIYPENISYNSDITQLNYTVDDDTSVSHCWYSLDGGSTNSSPDETCSNYTGLNAIEGSNNWTIYANDSIGQESSDVVFFTKDTTPPTIEFLSQAPTDIDSFIIFTYYLNISYNITDSTGVNASTVKIYYKTNSTTSDIFIYENGTSVPGYHTGGERASNVSEIWNFSINDNEIYPATYNFDEDLIRNITHLAYDLDSKKEYIKTRFFNVSNQKNYSFLEIYVENQTANSNALRIYYCNSSYSGDPVGNVNCINFYNLEASTPFNHSHTENSVHYAIPFTMNLSTGEIGNIYVTNTSYFLFRGLTSLDAWNIYYITNISRPDTIQISTNNGGAWSNFSGTTDVHLHQYDGSDAFWYYVCANDTLENENCAEGTVRYDLIDLAGIPPIAPEVYNPIPAFYSGNITINYTASLSPNSYPISFYNISLVDLNETYNMTIKSNNSLNLSYIWDSTNAVDGEYYIRVEVCDNQEQCSFGYSENITLDNSPPSISIVYPENNSNFSTASVDVNYTVSDVTTSIDSCWYSNSSGQYNYSITDCQNLTTQTWNQESNTVIIWVNDSAGNENLSSVTFFVDSLNPLIEFVSPTENNATSKARTWIFANVTITETNFQNVTFKLYNSTGLLNETTRTTQDFEINWTNLLDTNVQYWYNVSTYDQYGNFNQTPTRYITLTQDNPPTINIIYPENITYNSDVTQLNYTVEDDTSLSHCWYSLDGGATNSSPDSGCSNFTGLASIQGSNNWTVYANDSINQIGSDIVFFTRDTIFPQFSNYQRNPDPPNEDQNVQVNVTITETNLDTVILEWNGTTNYTVTTSNGNEYYFTILQGNYTAHESVTYYWYANDTVNNLNKSTQQGFTVANQIPSVDAPAINDTTPKTNDIISCDGGTFSDNDNDDTEQARYFKWYDTDIEISGQTSQTLDLSVSGLDKEDVIKCSVRVYDGYDNSSWTNSSNTATIQNSPPIITNPQTTVSWDANGSTFNYDYGATDADSGDSFTWYDNTTLFDINSGTGIISDTPTESEAGSYSILINVSDGTAQDTDEFTYTINDVTNPSIQFVSPTETNDSQLTRNYIQVNVTASDANGIGTITLRLYNSTSLVQTNTSSTSPLFVNFTNLPDENYYFNATVNDTYGNENQTKTLTVSTDTGPPTMNYISPTQNPGAYKSQNYVEINVTASDPNLDKIVIRLYNSAHTQINSTTTSSSPNFANFTGLSNGLYYYNATANDTFGNEDSLTTRNITLDTSIPSITNLIESPNDPATWTSSATYQFNATITDTNLDTVLIEFNSVNYTPTKTGNIYNLTLNDLAADTYNYYWWANDSSENINSTSGNYTINKASGDVTLLLNGSASNQTGTYGIQTNASASTSYGSVTLYRNSTDVTAENNIYVTLGASYYNYTAVSSGDQNHSSVSITRFVDISKAQSEINLTLNTTEGNVTVVQDSQIWLNLTTISGDSGATLNLYNNESLINQGTGPLSNFTTFNVEGLFNITGIYLESENYTSSSETWWVNVTETPDTENPSISSLTETPSDPAIYSPGQVYEFNATITDNRNIHTVLFEFGGVNYTPTNLFLNVYNVTFTDLSADNYNYRWYANDTTGNSNNTENGTYTINQRTPSLGLTITPSNNVNYPTETTANGTGCASQLTCNLYRNDTGEITPPDVATLGVGVYNYTYNTTGNANYTNAGVSDILTINQATGVVFTYINNSRANKTIEQYTEIYLNSTLETGTGNIKLYNNDSLIEQGASPLSNLTNFTTIGLYNITTIYDGNENYSSASETWWVNVTEFDVTPPQISITYPQNNTNYSSVQTQLNYTAWDNFGLNECWYSLNNGITNTTTNCNENITGLNSGQGSSTWTIWADDAKGNLNSSSVIFFVDSINPTINFVTPTETNQTILGRNYIQVNTTANDTNLDTIVIRLYNSTSLVNSSSNTTSPYFFNFTNLVDGTYYFNATANDTLGNNISTETRTISLVLPNLTIIKPENETYITTKNLLLNYIASYEDYVLYNIDNTANTTITGNTTFNTTETQHTLYLYANNTLGTTSKNATFFVNTTKFIVKYDNYIGTEEGNSTKFNASSFEDLQNLSDVILENTDYGKILFNETINMTDDANLSDNEIDLEVYTNLSENHIEIDTTALPNLNKSATLHLYNLSFSNPRILRDGSVCSSDICTKESYSSGTLKFTVTQFTTYSAEETPVEPVTPSAPGAGEGAGVECFNDSDCEGDEICWNYICVKLFDVKIIDFESPAKLGDFFDFTYFIKGMAKINDDVEIRFWIEKDGKKIASGSDVIYLGSFEEKTETTKIFLPSNVKSGIYDFYVEVFHRDYTARSHRTIEIEVREGIAIISPIDTKGIGIFVLIFALFLFVLILCIIFRAERKKIKKLLIKDEKWIKKHKLSVIAALLIIILVTLLYLSNLFDPIINLALRISLWFKLQILPNLIYIIQIILVIVLLIIFFIIAHKNKWLEKLEIKIKEKKKKRLIKKKYKAKVKKTRAQIKRFEKQEKEFFEKTKKKIKSLLDFLDEKISFRIKKTREQKRIRKRKRESIRKKRRLEKTEKRLKKNREEERKQKKQRKLKIKKGRRKRILQIRKEKRRKERRKKKKKRKFLLRKRWGKIKEIIFKKRRARKERKIRRLKRKDLIKKRIPIIIKKIKTRIRALKPFFKKLYKKIPEVKQTKIDAIGFANKLRIRIKRIETSLRNSLSELKKIKITRPKAELPKIIPKFNFKKKWGNIKNSSEKEFETIQKEVYRKAGEIRNYVEKRPYLPSLEEILRKISTTVRKIKNRLVDGFLRLPNKLQKPIRDLFRIKLKTREKQEKKIIKGFFSKRFKRKKIKRKRPLKILNTIKAGFLHIIHKIKLFFVTILRAITKAPGKIKKFEKREEQEISKEFRKIKKIKLKFPEISPKSKQLGSQITFPKKPKFKPIIPKQPFPEIIPKPPVIQPQPEKQPQEPEKPHPKKPEQPPQEKVEETQSAQDIIEDIVRKERENPNNKI